MKKEEEEGEGILRRVVIFSFWWVEQCGCEQFHKSSRESSNSGYGAEDGIFVE